MDVSFPLTQSKMEIIYISGNFLHLEGKIFFQKFSNRRSLYSLISLLNVIIDIM